MFGSPPRKEVTKAKARVRHHKASLSWGAFSKTPEGDNLCFAYNLSGCSEASDGAKCRRGHHLCAKCFGSHPISQHDSQ